MNEWCNRDSCTAWAGGTPTTHTAKDLFVKENYVGYGLSNYYDLDGLSYGSVLWGVGKGAVDFYAAAQSGGALWPLAVDGVFLVGGAIKGLRPEATYPIVSFVNPHNPPPWYIPQAGFTSLP